SRASPIAGTSSSSVANITHPPAPAIAEPTIVTDRRQRRRTASAVLLLFITVATTTSDGVRVDLGGAATSFPEAVRQLLLASVQITAVVVPIAVLVALVLRRRWRRSATIVGAAIAGAGAWLVLATLLDDVPAIGDALEGEAWLGAARFPSLAYVAGAVAAGAVGKPWLSRRWRRVVDGAVVVLAVSMAVAGLAGAPELALAVAAGGFTGSLILAALGAPNRRPTPAAVASALRAAGIVVQRLEVQRLAGGRSQLYRAATAEGPLFLKVYGQDTRDADLLYRTYRNVIVRDAGIAASPSVAREVEHEALLLLLAERGGVTAPALRAVVALPDGSMVLAMHDVGGRRLDELDDGHGDLLEAVWQEVAALHAAGLSHGALRAANVLVVDDGAGTLRPVIVDLGAGASAAPARAQAIDRAELLASLGALVGAEAAVAAAARAVPPGDLAAAMAYLQPLALSTGTRRAVSKSLLRDLRSGVAAVTDRQPAPLERLIRVRPRTVVTIVALTGAFYVLLPQLANVDDSVDALRSANWLWLAGAIAMSGLTYVWAGVGMMGGVTEDLPFVPTCEVALASSFVNRVTPANVGGMALNVRYMQKAGVPPAEAVTGVGLNVVAGGIVHIGLLAAFLAWAGRGGAGGFSIPASSTLMVGIVVVLGIVGIVLATRWGRRIARAHVVPPVRQSVTSIVSLARSPSRLAALFGGSIGVTLAYIAALACAVNAFDGGLSLAEVGSVFLGASLLAAAAPTPGGLGAMEAALVAGFTGVGLDPAIAVAAVLSYRLLTFWLPILPGWLCFHHLDRKNYL
ncbi:MAG: lysylphosphatidylglycerol synthase domain-containing protein, partial [Ilumatobacteraceae bacterium]